MLQSAWKLAFACTPATFLPIALLADDNQPVGGNTPHPPATPASTTHAGATAPGFAFHVSSTALQPVVGGAGKDVDVQAVRKAGFKGAITVNDFGNNLAGNRRLANGNVEYALCGLFPPASVVREVTMEENPKTVWSMSTTGVNLYRAFPVPSLYPGVKW